MIATGTDERVVCLGRVVEEEVYPDRKPLTFGMLTQALAQETLRAIEEQRARDGASDWPTSWFMRHPVVIASVWMTGTLFSFVGMAVAGREPIGYALSHTLTKKLGAHDTTLCILFFMMLIQLPVGFVPAAFDWATPHLAHLPWIIAVGVTGLTAHYCMVRAFKHADASVVVPMDLLRLPLVALVGFALYGERVDPFLALGAALILAGNFLNVARERKTAAAAASAGAADREAAR